MGFFDFFGGLPITPPTPPEDPGYRQRARNARESAKGFCPFTVGQKVTLVESGVGWTKVHTGEKSVGPDYGEVCVVAQVVNDEKSVTAGVYIKLVGYGTEYYPWRLFKPLDEAKQEDKKEQRAPTPTPFDDILKNPSRKIPEDAHDNRRQKQPQKEKT